MTDHETIIAGTETSEIQRAIRAINGLEHRLREIESARHEPIAVVGMACRFPGGADSPERFAELLADARDAVVPAPGPRPGWPVDASKLPPAGYLQHDVGAFDPTLFGIAPREAESIDPQQRLALECVWEALEDAGINPRGLERSRTGVFFGVTGGDYAHMQLAAGNAHELLHAHFASGIAHSMASGRIAYLLGLQGPAITVDTACSSSLVALHLACQSLRCGEVDLALVGGTHLILSTDFTIAFQSARMLSPDGRCKAFDAAADGFGRGEGCGVVALRRLSDAERDGDRILAVIRGTAVNQDGPSSGLTAPSGPAQEAVLRAALIHAGLAPRDVGYVEAHGTGTSLGDPIEAQALGAVYGEDRPEDQPLLVGTVKANLGHLEAAAGIAGLIKAVIALNRREVPAQPHFEAPSPHIPWDRLRIRVPTERTPFPNTNGRRRAGVSSFGFSGTNAHVILEEPPERPLANGNGSPAERPVQLLPLSAATPDALREQAERFARHLAGGLPAAAFADMCHTAGVGRAHLQERLAVVARSAEDAAATLAAFANGEEVDSRALRRGRAPVDRVRPVFLFTGQGAQRLGMGRGLYATEPVFRDVLERCDAILRRRAGLDLFGVMFGVGDDAARLLDRTIYVQPALVSLEVALAELWRSWGVSPAMVIGHSVGEFSAAIVAGAISLEDGLRLVAERAALMDALPDGGAMSTVYAGEDVLAELQGVREGELSIAAVNGPKDVTISGDASAVAAAISALTQRGIPSRLLRVSHAFHSRLMDPALEPLGRAAATVEVVEPRIPLVSNRAGRAVSTADLRRPDYWTEHARHTVRFHDCLEYARRRGHTLFLECGPSPTLCGIGAAGFPDPELSWIPSLRRDVDDPTQFATAAAALYAAGVDLDWAGRDRSWHRRRVRLPTYPFQRESLWVRVEPVARTAASATRFAETHPLLGERLRLPEPGWTWERTFDPRSLGFLADHVVDGKVIVPAAAFMEAVVAAAALGPGWTDATLSDVSIPRPLALDPASPRTMLVRLEPDGEARARARIVSIGQGDDDFALHLECLVHAEPVDLRRAEANARSSVVLDPADVATRCSAASDADRFYRALAARGLDFGPAFRRIAELRYGSGEALAWLVGPTNGEAEPYLIHPATLDAGIQAVAAALDGVDDSGTARPLYLPVAVNRVVIRPGAHTSVVSHVRVEAPGKANRDVVVASVRMHDAAGNPTVAIDRLVLKRRVDASATEPEGAHPRYDALYRVLWEPAPRGHRLPGSTPDASRATAREILAAVDDAGAIEFPEDTYAALYRGLDALVTGYIVAAFRAMGWSPDTGDRVDAGALVRELCIAPRHTRLIHRYLEILAEDGIVARTPDEAAVGWTVLQPLPDVDPGSLVASLTRTHAGAPELDLVTRCGPLLAAVLAGAADPLELLFPGGDTSVLTRLYRDSALARSLGTSVGRVIERLAAGASVRRPLRVMEIGGGTGGTTSHVLPALPPDSVAYTFTDIGPLFVERAREALGARRNTRFAVLDIDEDPVLQGFEPGQYDVVLAANVLHAARDVRAALERVRKLLAPGGALCALEVTYPERWFELTVGLLEGWWHFADTDLRPHHPLLPAAAWKRVLLESDFIEAELVDGRGSPPESPGESILSRHSLLVATAPPAALQAHWHEPGAGGATASATHARLENGTAPVANGRWVVFADRGGVADAFIERLDASATPVVRIAPEEAEISPSLTASAVLPILRSAADRLGGVTDVAWFRALDAAVDGTRPLPDPDLLDGALEVSCAGALAIVQALAAYNDGPPRLHLVTRGGQPANDAVDPVAPSQATLWGLARAATAERPEIRIRCVDLPPGVETPSTGPLVAAVPGGEAWVGVGGTSLEALFEELLDPDDEPEIAIRSGGRRVPRLRPITAPTISEKDDDSTRISRRWVYGTSGRLDDLRYEPAPRRQPGPGEIEIRIDAAGLNFRDVVHALGLRRDVDALGTECVGVVTEVGEGVTHVCVGDRIMAAGGVLGEFATLPAGLAVRVPASLSIPQAATLPIAFLTADYALNEVGGARHGESVLIHAAAGGVGMAALQLARTAGLTVYATAGTPEKRALVRSLGARAVFDSRSTTFVGELMAATGGRGVDLVLNSLAGEFIPASLCVLAPGGRLLELGKTGIWTQAQVDAFDGAAHGVRYLPVDLTPMLLHEPDLIRERLERLVARVEAGELRPLPVRTFPMHRAPDAFREMAAGKHVGKLVL
ncbi:MAG TPA: beta-ketoacyl synthase N-terminal-like domain-containing protein, partial [Longimicrobiales bacterium]|nr:beta-ketoacyl synthase N-terminal-like domain-containing protein [Longimicrobiales bacterium]